MIKNSEKLGIDLMAKDNDGHTGFEKARIHHGTRFSNLIKNLDWKLDGWISKMLPFGVSKFLPHENQLQWLAQKLDFLAICFINQPFL